MKRISGIVITQSRINGCDVFLYNEGDQYRAVVYGPDFRGRMAMLYTCRGELPGTTEKKARDKALNMVVRK